MVGQVYIQSKEEDNKIYVRRGVAIIVRDL